MSRWIDADVLMNTIKPMCGMFTDEGFMVDYHRVLSIITDAPSINIVRCKECKYCNELVHPNGIELYCNNPNVDPFDWGGSVSFYVKADGFCSYGELETDVIVV